MHNDALQLFCLLSCSHIELAAVDTVTKNPMIRNPEHDLRLNTFNVPRKEFSVPEQKIVQISKNHISRKGNHPLTRNR